MNPVFAEASFILGVMVAEHVHGIRRVSRDPRTHAIYQALKEIADGELTLINTPEEIFSGIKPPPEAGDVFRDLIRLARDYQRIVAADVVKAMPSGQIDSM